MVREDTCAGCGFGSSQPDLVFFPLLRRPRTCASRPARNGSPSAATGSNTRYSTLTQISRGNVKNLKAAWVVHLGSGLGQKYSLEGTPIVKDGIMYFATGNDDVSALDAQHRRADLGAPLRPRPEHQHRVLRLGQSRRRGRRGQGVRRPARRHLRGARRQDRQGGVAHRDRQVAGRLHHHRRAALLQRRGLYRHFRRRPRSARQAHRARCQDRQGAVAFLDGARSRRRAARRPGRRRTIPIPSAPRPICTAAPTSGRRPPSIPISA